MRCSLSFPEVSRDTQNGQAHLFGTERPGSLHERIYHSLVHAIGSGRFEVGTLLPPELQLASMFKVSRPVVRQALERLKLEGLVESRRGSGNYVMAAQSREQHDLSAGAIPLMRKRLLMDELEFRLAVEPEAAFLAARRRISGDLDLMETALVRLEEAHLAGAITHHYDYRFHEAIATATTNERFVRALRSLEYNSEEIRTVRYHFYSRPGTHNILIQEHRSVFEFIKRRDAEAARKAMWNHIDSARLWLTKFELVDAPVKTD